MEIVMIYFKSKNMKKKISGLILMILTTFAGQAQDKPLSLYDSAYVSFQKKDYEKALYYYDRHYSSTTSPDNYGTYYAALSACQVGRKDKAIYYLKKSADIGFDLSEYDHFANNPLTECLKDVPEWNNFISTFKRKVDSATLALSIIRKKLTDTSRRINTTRLNDLQYWQRLSEQLSPSAFSQRIKTFQEFPDPKQKGFWTLYKITIADTLEIPFLLYIPKNYHPNRKTGLYTYLHGAVVNKLEFPEAANAINGPEASMIRDQLKDNYFILYPLGKRNFGWVYQQEAFETILKQISYVKSRYNIDDERVFLGGHSNGGSGSFWFAMKKPSSFAGFFAFNFLPASYSSNTTLRNLDNSWNFFGLSGKEDKTFPATLVENIYTTAQAAGTKWKNGFLEGGHLLPFEKSDSITFIFQKIASQKREQFPKNVIWETDDVRNGKVNWIEITKLDTLTSRSPWHVDIVPSMVKENKVKIPFNRNKTGSLRAQIKGNDVYVETSCIKEVKLYVYEGMFETKKNIRVHINGRLLFDSPVALKNSVILQEFLKNKDRTQILTNVITIPL